jgi:hypothetical protein
MNERQDSRQLEPSNGYKKPLIQLAHQNDNHVTSYGCTNVKLLSSPILYAFTLHPRPCTPNPITVAQT